MSGATFCGLGKKRGAVTRRKSCSKRLASVWEVSRRQLEGIEHRPRVAIVECLQPFYVAGHWVPEMIELAGGRDVLGRKRTPSFRVTVEEVLEADPEILLIALCGYTAAQAQDEYFAMTFPAEWNEMAAARGLRVYALDATSHFSRPGPRLITGVEALAKILHPGLAVSAEAEQAFQLLSSQTSTVLPLPGRSAFA